MLSFTSMKFHGLWVLDIKWILKVFHLTNDAVNPTWDVWFTFQVASTFTRILYSPFYRRLVRQTCHFFNLYFRSRSYTWPKFWRPRFHSRGQITSLMLYSFAGLSCLFLWVLIFCFYTCGLTESAHRNHFVWHWPNYVARPHVIEGKFAIYHQQHFQPPHPMISYGVWAMGMSLWWQFGANHW